MFWAEPLEAKRALVQATEQRSESLAIGTVPLGKAFALCEGATEEDEEKGSTI